MRVEGKMVPAFKFEVTDVRTKYPKYAHYTELIEILGEEVGMKEAAARMQKPDKTLYGWLKRLRPIFDEFKDTVDYL